MKVNKFKPPVFLALGCSFLFLVGCEQVEEATTSVVENAKQAATDTVENIKQDSGLAESKQWALEALEETKQQTNALFDQTIESLGGEIALIEETSPEETDANESEENEY